MKLRSLLFAPGDSDRKATRALASDADGVILDLEDSVASAAKDIGRALTAALLRGASRPVIVRVNPRGTPWYLDDLAACVPGRPASVLLPKCSGPADLAALDHHLEALEAANGLPPGGIGILALVTETALSLRAMDYAGSPERLVALCFGAEDLSADLGIAPRGPGGYPPSTRLGRTPATLKGSRRRPPRPRRTGSPASCASIPRRSKPSTRRSPRRRAGWLGRSVCATPSPRHPAPACSAWTAP